MKAAITTFITSAIVAAATVVGAGTGHAAAALPGPAPLADSWFAAPSDLSHYKNGDVIRSRKVGVRFPKSLTWDGAVTATQLLYRTTDSHGTPVTTATTVVVPHKAWAGPGRRPIFGQQQAMDALGLQCNPSVTLRKGSNQDLAMMAPFLARGYAVVASDYQGPKMAWIAARQTAHGVLDGIRAAKRFPSLGLQHSPTVLYGYSGGGFATAWAAELRRSYAPDVQILGAAAGGVPGDLAQLSLRQKPVGFTAWGILLGLAREYPDRVRPQDYLNAEGIAFAKTLSNGCLNDLLSKTKGVSLAKYSKVGDIMAIPSVRAVVAENSLGRTAAKPDMPLYVFHDTKDTLIPDWGMTGVVRGYCAKGVRVQYARGPGIDHVPYGLVGVPPSYQWLDDRVMRRPFASTC